MKRTLLSCTIAAIAGLLSSAPAMALSPVHATGLAKSLSAFSASVEQIDFRDWRHCHWRDGERFCHRGGGSYNRFYGDRYYGYGGSPGIYLNLGGHRHHRQHWRHGHNWR